MPMPLSMAGTLPARGGPSKVAEVHRGARSHAAAGTAPRSPRFIE